MLGKSLRDTVGNEMEKAQEQYKKTYCETVVCTKTLYEVRKAAAKVLVKAEAKIDKYKSTPSDIKKDCEEINIKAKSFLTVSELAEKESKKLSRATKATVAVSAASINAAVSGPVAVAAFATTFGTTSTGVAISSLSGAAASNAVLAWIGGGALSAGGGGVAMGEAVLAAMGPIGWMLGAGLAIGVVGYIATKNSRIAKAEEKTVKKIMKSENQLKAIKNNIKTLTDRTKTLDKALSKAIKGFGWSVTSDYEKLSIKQKEALKNIVNNAFELSELFKVVIK